MSETIIAGHQPNYLPYLGFFDKMKRCDAFFILDDAQFCKRDFHHRNRIKSCGHESWLTIPVHKDEIPIKDISIKWEIINSGMEWHSYHLSQIMHNYHKCPHFTEYFCGLTEVYMSIERDKDSLTLSGANQRLIRFMMDSFKISKELVVASDFGLKTRSTQRIVDLCNILGASTYLSGDGAKAYLDEHLFEEAGINLVYQSFKHPVYEQQKQLREDFIPFLSAIDYLFNEGGDLPF